MIVKKELKKIEKSSHEDVLKTLYEIVYAGRLNPFKIMRNGDHEIRHSNVIAWLLDKDAKNHGLGNEFAVKMFSSIEDYMNVNWKEKFSEKIFIDTEISADTKYFEEILRTNSEIKKEYDAINKKYCKKSKDKKHIDILEEEVVDESKSKDEHEIIKSRDRKIDILIVGDTFTCTIENKFGSCEHNWQCQYYRYYIQNQYPDKKNYFIFLDIEEPWNWKEESLKYDGYKLLTYKSVITMLRELTANKNETDNIKFIKQYIEILEEQYGIYAPEIEKILIEKFGVIKDVIALNQNDIGVTKRLLDAKKIFHNYAINNIRIKNDELIRTVLINDLINKKVNDRVDSKEKKLVEYHGGKASVTDPYGYKINIKNYNNHGKEKNIKIKNYLNEIDYVAKYGYYNVNIYFNKNNAWIKDVNSVEKYNKFFENLKSLKMDKKREVWIEYNIKPGTGQSGTKFSFALDLEKSDSSAVIEYWRNAQIVSRTQKIKDLIRKDNGELQENHIIFQMLSDTRLSFYDRSEKNISYDDIKQYIKEYYKNGNKQLTFEWVVAIEYTVNDKAIVTDAERNDISKKLKGEFYQRTQEGLNILKLGTSSGFGDEFVNKIFQS